MLYRIHIRRPLPYFFYIHLNLDGLKLINDSETILIFNDSKYELMLYLIYDKFSRARLKFCHHVYCHINFLYQVRFNTGTYREIQSCYNSKIC